MINLPSPVLFCGACSVYIGPFAHKCPACGQKRPADEISPEPGKPLWQQSLVNQDHKPIALNGMPVFAQRKVIFCGSSTPKGLHHKQGYVIALDAQTGKPQWAFSTQYGSESGSILADERLYIATWKPIGSGAALHCLDALTGQEIWPAKPLSGGVWSQPVIMGGRVYVGCADGKVYCFDRQYGGTVANWPVTLERNGRLWLLPHENRLIVLTEKGKVCFLDALRGGEPIHSFDVGVKITSGATHHDNRLYFGVDAGSIFSLDLKDYCVRLVADGMNAIKSAPVITDGRLYVGAADHQLHAIDLRTPESGWQCQFDHSLITSPYPLEGLVFVTVNGGDIGAVEANTGKVVWHYQLSPEASLVTHPLVHAGVVYAGGSDGIVAALPWHGGEFAWFAAWAEKRKLWDAAAALAVAAGDCPKCDPLERKKLYAQSVQIWRQTNEREKAARLRETLLDEASIHIAREYEAAVTQTPLARHDKMRAAQLLFKAADWYIEAGDETSALRCWQMAKKAAFAPHIQIQKVLFPAEWEAGEKQRIALELKNTGPAPASQIRVRFGGSSLEEPGFQTLVDLLPGATVEVGALLKPSCSGELVIDVHYTAPNDQEWFSHRRFPMKVNPSTTCLEVEGNVAVLVTPKMAPHRKIKVHGDVGWIEGVSELGKELS